MAFQLSPGVLVKEVDLTNVVPAVATSVGAIAGVFEKGPLEEIRTVSSEEELVKLFGKPNGSNFETFFAASNFLQYGNTLRVVRATTGMLNAMSGGSGLLIKNDEHYENNYAAGQGSSGEFGARTPGTHGNALGVALCAGADAYEQTFSGNAGTLGVTTGTPAAGATTVGVDTGGGSAGAGGAAYNVGDIVFFQEADGQQYEVTGISTDTLTIRRLDDPNGGGLKTALSAATNVRRRWAFYDLLDSQIFLISAIMIFPSIFGYIIGEKIRSFISEQLFETLLLIFLLIVSINLLYKSDFIAYFIKTFGKS